MPRKSHLVLSLLTPRTTLDLLMYWDDTTIQEAFTGLNAAWTTILVQISELSEGMPRSAILQCHPIRCAVEDDRKHDDLCMGATGYKTL